MIGWLNLGLKMTIPYHNNYYVTLVECFSSITDSGFVSMYIHSSTLLVFSKLTYLSLACMISLTLLLSIYESTRVFDN